MEQTKMHIEYRPNLESLNIKIMIMTKLNIISALIFFKKNESEEEISYYI